MRRLLILALTVAGIGLALSFVLPWWILAPLGAVSGWALKTSPGVAWAGGFLGGAILWGGMALYLDSGNEGILSGRMAAMAEAESPYVLIFVTAVIGALLASFGSLTGSLARQMIR